MRIISGKNLNEDLVAYAPDHEVVYSDPSLGTPDQQFQTLVTLLENADAASPAPYTGTPPWGESIPVDEYVSEGILEESYLIEPDLQGYTDTELQSVMEDADGPRIPDEVWYNDDQYFGLAVPPGMPNIGQPIESGHTQINPPDPAAEVGWDAWSGRPILARVARHENNFPGYSAGVSRGHGVVPIKLYQPYVARTQQMRDLLLAEIQRRGIHNVVVADIPTVPYTEQVQVVDPTVLAEQMPIGPEGVLP